MSIAGMYTGIILLAFSMTVSAQSVSLKEIKVAEGNWSGTYSRIDSISKKKIVRPVSVRISSIGRERLLISYAFPNQLQQPYTDTLLVTSNGHSIGDGTIIERATTEDGAIQLLTEKNGTASGVPVRNNYLLGKNRVQLARLVRSAAGEWIITNEYLLAR